MYIKNEYYSILNSKRTDTLSVIKKNYRNLAKIHHPDVGGDEEYFKKINLAMDIINEFHEETSNTSNFKSTNSKNNSKKNYNSNKTNRKSTNYRNTNKDNHKTKNKSNGHKNNSSKCSRCGSQFDENDVYCTQCGQKRYKKDNSNDNGETAGLLCVGVIVVAIGLLLFSLCWPFGILYFYLLYKYLSS